MDKDDIRCNCPICGKQFNGAFILDPFLLDMAVMPQASREKLIELVDREIFNIEQRKSCEKQI